MAKRGPRGSSKTAALVRGTARSAVASVAGRLPWSQDDDPIRMLEADHRRLEALFEEGEKSTARGVKKRTELLERLTEELQLHERREEKVLYPALKPHTAARDVVLEGYQEHHVADVLVRELHALPRDDERWGAKFKVLKENIEHHIEEEEGLMFRTARGVLSREELQAIAARMKKMR